jgi:hypothetical protein
MPPLDGSTAVAPGFVEQRQVLRNYRLYGQCPNNMKEVLLHGYTPVDLAAVTRGLATTRCLAWHGSLFVSCAKRAGDV